MRESRSEDKKYAGQGLSSADGLAGVRLDLDLEAGQAGGEEHEGTDRRSLDGSGDNSKGILHAIKGAEHIIQEQRQNLTRLKKLLDSNVQPSLVMKRESTKSLPMLNMHVIKSDSDSSSRRLSMESVGFCDVTPTYSSISAKTRSRQNSSQFSSCDNTPTSVFFPELVQEKSFLEGPAMSWEEASNILESRDLIAEEHSSADNAAHLLQQFMRQCHHLEVTDKAIITYAIRTLQSDVKLSTIPQALFSPNHMQGSPIMRQRVDSTVAVGDGQEEKAEELYMEDAARRMKALDMALRSGDDEESCIPDEDMRLIYELTQHEVAGEEEAADQEKFHEQLTSTWMVYTRLKETIMTLLDKHSDKRSGTVKRKGLAMLMKELIFDYEPKGDDIERILRDAKKIGQGSGGRGELAAAIVMWYKHVKEERGLLKRDKPGVSSDVKEWIVSFFTPFSAVPVFSGESRGNTPRLRSNSLTTGKFFLNRVDPPPTMSMLDERSHLPLPERGDYPLPASWDEQELQQMEKVLEGVDEWGWSPFELAQASGMRPIQALGWHLLRQWNVLEELTIDESTMRNWLAFVESKYKDNPYHNAIHASDILQTVHFLLKTGKLASYLTQKQITVTSVHLLPSPSNLSSLLPPPTSHSCLLSCRLSSWQRLFTTSGMMGSTTTITRTRSRTAH
uniref:PDEase domain-containing protein n=1 Tax=Hanusia phi TaxID=3032 RepID=A0A7S0EZF5_9CRYP